MRIDASILVIMVLFWISFAITRNFLFRPVAAILERRAQRIDAARIEFEGAEIRYQQDLEMERRRLTEIGGQARTLRDEHRKRAQEERQAVLATAREQADEELTKAAGELNEQVDHERAKLDIRARDLADQIAERLLGRPA